MKKYKITSLKPINKWVWYTGLLFLTGCFFLAFTLSNLLHGNGIASISLIVGLSLTAPSFKPFFESRKEHAFFKKIKNAFESKEYLTLNELATIAEADKTVVKSALNFLATEGCLIQQDTGITPKEFENLESQFLFKNLKKINHLHIDLTQYKIRAYAGRVQFSLGIILVMLGISDVMTTEGFSLITLLYILLGIIYFALSIDTMMKRNYVIKIKSALDNEDVTTFEQLENSTGISKDLLIHSLERLAGEGCLIDLNSLDKIR